MIPTSKFVILFKKNPKIIASNGQSMPFRDYLDKAIEVFDLKPYDYFTAFFLLSRKAEGADTDLVLGEIQEFWNNIDRKHSNHLKTHYLNKV